MLIYRFTGTLHSKPKHCGKKKYTNGTDTEADSMELYYLEDVIVVTCLANS